jgi:hypothetical protein
MLKFAALSCAALLAGAISAQAATQTLFDDDFNVDSFGVSGYDTRTTLNKWNILQGNVDALGTAYGCTGCIDLDGTSATAPAVLQTKDALTFQNGVTYLFQLFFSGGSQAETITLSVVGSVNFVAGSGVSVFSHAETAFGTITSPMMISLGGPVDNFGPYLDRVLITYDDGVAAVPLPAAAPMLLAGLGAMGAMARRRRVTKA